MIQPTQGCGHKAVIVTEIVNCVDFHHVNVVDFVQQLSQFKLAHFWRNSEHEFVVSNLQNRHMKKVNNGFDNRVWNKETRTISSVRKRERVMIAVGINTRRPPREK